MAAGTRFVRCTFAGASLRQILWVQRTTFENCTFDGAVPSGSVAGSVFVNGAPADLSACITDHVQVR